LEEVYFGVNQIDLPFSSMRYGASLAPDQNASWTDDVLDVNMENDREFFSDVISSGHTVSLVTF
jgi:hypothetical protein